MSTGVSKTHYLETAMLNAALRNIAFTPPATVYLALFSATIDDRGATSSTEIGVIRQAITFGAPSNSGSTPGSSCTNTNSTAYPAIGSSYVPSYMAIMDAVSGGNMLYYGATTNPPTVPVNTAFTVPAGAISIIED